MGSELLHYTKLFDSCNAQNLLRHGRQLHLLFLKKGILRSALTLGNRLLQVYVKCGCLMDARKLFDEMPQRNCFSWNTLIEGYMGSGGDRGKSMELFGSMPCKNDFSWNVMISGFAKAGDLGQARLLFDQMPRKNGIAWNSMIHVYARNGYCREALRLFKELNLCPLGVSGRNSFVLATVVSGCTSLLDVDCGKQIHAHIIVSDVEFDPILGSSLVNLYGKCGDLDSAEHVLRMMVDPDDFSMSALITGYANVGRISDARSTFDRIINPSVAVWNSIIAGYVSNNDMEAFVLFKMMREKGFSEDFSTVSSLLCASSSIGGLGHGNQLHAHACKLGFSEDVVVSCSLIDMYSKCGSTEHACELFHELEFRDTVLLNSMINVYCNSGKVQEAKQIFDTMPHRSLISWNSMIVGLSQNGLPYLALDVFLEMNDSRIKMDKFSLASIISACGCISALEFGEQVFARATIIGLEADPVIRTSLIDFYCKCGFVDVGRKLFDGLEKSDQASWNAMLMGYATNGHGLHSLSLFTHMQHTAVVQPNDITFTAILSVCDHCGLVEEARKWFRVMQSEYHINPGFEHYSCMVDLLARAGCLEEAIGLIEQMPFDPDSSMWSAVLKGCTAHGDRALGEKVAALAADLDPTNAGSYVQLAGVFASHGDWHSSSQVRSRMRWNNVGKNPGLSWGYT